MHKYTVLLQASFMMIGYVIVERILCFDIFAAVLAGVALGGQVPRLNVVAGRRPIKAKFAALPARIAATNVVAHNKLLKVGFSDCI